MDDHKMTAGLRPANTSATKSRRAPRVPRVPLTIAVTAGLLGVMLLLAPDDAMAASIQGIINRFGNLFRNAIPRLADLSYFASPFLFVGALLISLCKRHWSMVGGTMALGIGYVVNMHNSEALPQLTAESASLYHTSNGVFLAIGGVLLMIFFRLLFASK